MLAGERLLTFVTLLRDTGLRIDISRVQSFLEALEVLNAQGLAEVYKSGRLTLCARQPDLPIFDRCFRHFFLNGDLNDRVIEPDPEAPPMLPGSAAAKPRRRADDQREIDIGATSSDERLRLRNLAHLSDEERRQVYALIARMRGRIAMRRTRRHVSARTGGLDIRKTVRAALQRAGEPDILHRHRRGRLPRRRVFLLDVSGSMSPYAGGLIRLAYAAHHSAPHQTEVFTIGTRLTRVTSYLRTSDAEAAIVAASAAIPDWSGGTRLGDQLKAFLDLWGHRGMARGAKVVLASDGWERGDSTLLSDQMQRLDRLARQIIWVNPHVSTAGFEPLTRGMQAALPFIGRLVSGSTAKELEMLLEILAE